MAQSVPRDANDVPVMMGALNTDGSTPTAVAAEPTEHYVYTNDDTTGTSLSTEPSVRDQNRVTGLMAVSSADGVTPIPLYVDADGKLLVDSS